MSKRTTEKLEELQQEINEWARKTYVWALAQDCYRDEDSNEIRGYFTLEKSKSKEAKPSWCEWSEEEKSLWPAVAEAMIAQGVPICSHSFSGHYIGVPGEQGAKIGTGINHMITRAETARRQIESVIYSQQWEHAIAFLQQRLRPDIKAQDVYRLLEVIDQLLIGSGIPVQRSFAQLFLEAAIEPNGEKEQSA